MQRIRMNLDKYEKVKGIALQSMCHFSFHMAELYMIRASTRRTTEPEEHLLQELENCLKQLHEMYTNEQEPI